MSLFDRFKKLVGYHLADTEFDHDQSTHGNRGDITIVGPLESMRERGWIEFIAQAPANKQDIEHKQAGMRRSGYPQAKIDEAANLRLGVATMVVSPESDGRLAVRVIATNKDYRRQGLARALYANIINYAKQHGFSELISDPEGGTKPELFSLWRSLGAKEFPDAKQETGQSRFRLDLAKNSKISYEHYPYHRPLSKYESRVDFKQADDTFSRLISTTDEKLRAVLRKAQKDVVKQATDAIRILNPSLAGTFKVDVGDEFYRVFRDFLLDAWREGKDQGYEELPEAIKKDVRQVKQFHYPGGQEHDQQSHGNWANGDGSEKPLEVYLTPDQVERYNDSWGGGEIGFQIKGKPGAFWKGKILSRDQVPETIYHVTIAKDAVENSGYLLGQNNAGGMGGGNGLAGVSLTTSKETAEFIAREMTRSATLAQTVRSREDYVTLLDKFVAEDYEIGGSTQEVSVELTKAKDYALDNFDANIDQYIKYRQDEPDRFTGNAFAVLASETYSAYLQMRSNLAYKDFDNRNTHPLRNPLLMGGNDARMKQKPDQIGIVEVKREMIPENALVRRGTDEFLQEIRVHADIPLRKSIKTKKHGDGQYFVEFHYPGGQDHDQDTHGNWANGQAEGGFYSPLSRSLESAKQKAAPASDWIAIVSKSQGVTKDELVATGVIEWLKAKGAERVNRDDLIAFAKEHAVEITPVVLGAQSAARDAAAERYRAARDAVAKQAEAELIAQPGLYAVDVAEKNLSQWQIENMSDAMRPLAQEARDAFQVLVNTPSEKTKFEQYTLPGGENYREMLLTLPTGTAAPEVISELPEGYDIIQDKSQPERFQWGVTPPGQAHARPFAGSWATPEEAERAALAAINADAAFKAEVEQGRNAFQSAHYDQPNIVAHLRMNERVDADGNKILFLEEIQSDWAQKGRADGFKADGPDLSKRFIVWDKDGNPTESVDTQSSAKIRAEYIGGSWQDSEVMGGNELHKLRNPSGVPSAPFVTDTKDWVELSMKHAIAEAVRVGATGVAWTTGEQQADRYDLAKQIDSIKYIPNGDGTFNTFVLKGHEIPWSDKRATPKVLEDVLGKEIAKKIVNDANEGLLTGLDLRVGGEGMKSFYDSIVPNVAGKLIRKSDPAANIEKLKMVFANLSAQWEYVDPTTGQPSREAGAVRRRKNADGPTSEQQGFYITKKMREMIRKGIALFEEEREARTYAGFEPRQAIDYLTTKALVIKGLLDNELTEDVRQLLLEHLKGGRTTTETMMDLRELFEPWIGNPEKIAPSGQVGINTPPGTKSPDNVLQAYRLENMIRTPLIEAYNQGRLAIGDATDDYVIGYQYSAILDTRTTDICENNDGLMIRVDDPRLRKLTPPVHFQALAGGTLINTENGQKPIERIELEDRVLTHRGRYMPVYAVMARDDLRSYRELKLSTGRTIRVSDEHPILTSTGWKNARSLKVGDVLYQSTNEPRRSFDVLLPNPENFPSPFDQPLIPYKIMRLALSRMMIFPVDLKNHHPRRESEVGDIRSDRILKDEIHVTERENVYDGLLCDGRRPSISRALAFRDLVADAPLEARVGDGHSLRMGAMDGARFLGHSKRPMVGAALRSARSSMQARSIGLTPDCDAVLAAELANSVIRESALAFERPNRASVGPVFSSDQNSQFINVNWHAATIMNISIVVNEGRMWNLAVEEDETYLAEDVIVHNCRSLLVYVTIDDTPVEWSADEELDAAVDRIQEGFS